MEGVTVIGAGPAGLAAAIVLGRLGTPVTVVEKAPRVGHRMNGDFQGLENWTTGEDVLTTLSRLGLAVNFLCRPCYEGVVHPVGGPPVVVRSQRPIFYLVQRGPGPGTLDSGLKEQALDAGARIVFGRPAPSRRGPAIAATGPVRAGMAAVGMTFDTSSPDTVAVVLDDGVVPKGYAYLLIHGGRGTMAAFLPGDPGRGRQCFERSLRFFSSRTGVDVRNGRKFAGIGNCFVRRTLVEDGKLLAGEAAGFQDGLWGFGMRYALQSAHLAAKSIIEGCDYDALCRDELGPLLETSLLNRYLFEKMGSTGYRYLARRLGRQDPVSYLRRLYNPSPLKSLLLPLAGLGRAARDRGCRHGRVTPTRGSGNAGGVRAGRSRGRRRGVQTAS